MFLLAERLKGAGRLDAAGILAVEAVAETPVEDLGGVREQISKDAELIKRDAAVAISVALVEEFLNRLLLEVDAGNDEGMLQLINGDVLVIVDVNLVEDRLNLIWVDDAVAGVVDVAALRVGEVGDEDLRGGGGDLQKVLLGDIGLEDVELGLLVELVAVLEGFPLLARLLVKDDDVDGEGEGVLVLIEAILAEDKLDLLGHVGEVVGLRLEGQLEVNLLAVDVGAAVKIVGHANNG